ncbi:4Fe-4S dicluster protein [Geothermobacter ehrlichii]|uniref:4Fe-4S dicluster protein n=1 Tax=Geothermobacter ehrlichii TaxID=213224 RepID=A0A5D3WJU0_9BACT|nr:4Fe-4S dicluster domain-containing protein [Geothermobacter ehrlichii]TYO98571.1 4Fe-4S dicluster protein [Geothermobacter ehrlichii]
MFSFLKILARNLILGPSTDPFPHGETFTPEGLRGKIRFDASACVGCRMCEHVCAAGAIRIEETADKSGLEFVLWHNSCAFCGLCEHYCQTKAIRLTEDWHMAHRQEEKYGYVEKGVVGYVPCSRCGDPMVPVAPQLMKIAYRETNRDIEKLRDLCPDCRLKQSVGGR